MYCWTDKTRNLNITLDPKGNYHGYFCCLCCIGMLLKWENYAQYLLAGQHCGTVDHYEENGDGVRLKMRFMLLNELSWLLAVVE